MLKYMRKPGSGKMHIMSRKGGTKARKASHQILRPGDIMNVDSETELPGYPHSMDGWMLVGSVVEETSFEDTPQVPVKRSRSRS